MPRRQPAAHTRAGFRPPSAPARANRGSAARLLGRRPRPRIHSPHDSGAGAVTRIQAPTPVRPMQAVLDWLEKNHAALVKDLVAQVAVPSISTDGEHQKEIERTAALTCEQMRQAGLQNVEVLRSGDSNPYAYGEWLGAPGKPTVFLYAHHDVQPVNFADQWLSGPWTLTPRDGRPFGRGAADDQGATTAP